MLRVVGVPSSFQDHSSVEIYRPDWHVDMPVRLVGLGTAPAVLSFGGGAYAPEKILVEAPLYMQNVRISHFDGEYSSAGATFGVRGTIVLEDCGVATNCSGSAVNLQAGSRAWFHRTSFESVPDYDYPRYVIEIEGGCFGAARCTFKPPAEEAFYNWESSCVEGRTDGALNCSPGAGVSDRAGSCARSPGTRATEKTGTARPARPATRKCERRR